MFGDYLVNSALTRMAYGRGDDTVGWVTRSHHPDRRFTDTPLNDFISNINSRGFLGSIFPGYYDKNKPTLVNDKRVADLARAYAVVLLFPEIDSTGFLAQLLTTQSDKHSIRGDDGKRVITEFGRVITPQMKKWAENILGKETKGLSWKELENEHPDLKRQLWSLYTSTAHELLPLLLIKNTWDQHRKDFQRALSEDGLGAVEQDPLTTSTSTLLEPPGGPFPVR
jgi:hypothetical protein